MKIDTTVNMKTLVIVSIFFIIIIAFIIYSNNLAEKRRSCSINCGDFDDCIRQCEGKGLKGYEYDSCLKGCLLEQKTCLDRCR